MERLVRRTRQNRTIGRIRCMALLLTLAILGFATVSHGAPSVSASLDARRFSVDQTATLTIIINDADGTIAELPSVDGLDFVKGGEFKQTQIVNWSSSSMKSFLFQVMALRPGPFTIPPIAITVDGKQLLTQAITFEVTPAAAGIPSLLNQQGGGIAPPSQSKIQTAGEKEQMAFLRISPVKEESYTGEVLPIEIKAYFRRGLRATLNSQPRLNGDGFVLTESKQEPVQTEEMVGNIPYSVLTWPGTLSGIKEGRHSVSVAIEATLLLPDNRRRSAPMGGDPFFGNDLFADFFNQQQVQEKKIQIVSKDMTLQVLSLPSEGKPADFSGAIGKFELQVKAQPTDVGPGDPITLTMTVAGTGNFDRVEAPVLSQAEGWKSYPPSAKFTPGGGLGQGEKVFEQAIIARSGDKTSIPSLSFSFFDPETKKYQTLHTDPIPLRHNKTEGSEKSENVSADDGAGATEGQGRPDVGAGKTMPQKSNGDQSGRSDAAASLLAPLHQQMGSLQQGFIPLISQTGFQMVVLILLLLLVAVTLFKIRARRLTSNPVLCRQREMARFLELRLREIKKAQEQGNSRDFLAICRRTIQEQLGLLWQTGPAAITLADLRQRLATDSELIALFATAESGAYVGNILSSQELAEYAGKLEHALRQLR
ncbi:MAG: BatD family protein [Deltaproteobacteria bacterium]|nr:BatD family protein [Deltaproteobacteria bacterium]